LRFLNTQYLHKLRAIEKESKDKSKKILELQEKNLQAVIQTPSSSTFDFILTTTFTLLNTHFYAKVETNKQFRSDASAWTLIACCRRLLHHHRLTRAKTNAFHLTIHTLST
jgi:hypothetical protein